MLRSAATCCLALALMSGPVLASSVLKKWPDGPIHYISEKAEMKVFKKLDNDEDRALFIVRFWARRDPSPHTLTNEFRQMFWERVHDANSLFLDSPRPGWKTDRGKIYVLYGPPTRIEDLPSLDVDSQPGSGHGLIRWYYEGRPGGRVDVSPVVVVPFVREVTGEYKVSYDPKLASIFFDEWAYEEKWDAPIDRMLELMGAPRDTELSVMLDLGRMQEIPPQAQILLERVETTESYRTHPIDVLLTRYRHPDENGTVAVITVDVSHIPADTLPSVIARFRTLDAMEDPRMLGEDSFRVEERDGMRIAQARLVLDPGDYDITVLVANLSTAATGMFRDTFRILPPMQLLGISDIVLADELSALEYASLASYDEAFHVGPFRVVPRLESDFLRGQTVNLFFEVYGGESPYRITYQIEGKELDDTWRPLGEPSVGEQSAMSQAWGVTTSAAWPTGDYRIRIDIEDRAERLFSAQVPFTLKTEDSE